MRWTTSLQDMWFLWFDFFDCFFFFTLWRRNIVLYITIDCNLLCAGSVSCCCLITREAFARLKESNQSGTHLMLVKSLEEIYIEWTIEMTPILLRLMNLQGGVPRDMSYRRDHGIKFTDRTFDTPKRTTHEFQGQRQDDLSITVCQYIVAYVQLWLLGRV